MPANFVDKTIWTGDNLDILRGLNFDSVDLIYLDPPFNSNRTYEAPLAARRRARRSRAHGRSATSTWRGWGSLPMSTPRSAGR
ncbi:MAG: hypothetical protein F4W93_06715 [Dehalococcoidia bacterium]|nr:hypothetical protein [Dehalococcoidia bacterium]